MPLYVCTHGGVWIGRRLVPQGEAFEATVEQAASLQCVAVVPPAPVVVKPAPVPVVPLAVKKAKATP